jgi:hypothetical protein
MVPVVQSIRSVQDVNWITAVQSSRFKVQREDSKTGLFQWFQTFNPSTPLRAIQDDWKTTPLTVNLSNPALRSSRLKPEGVSKFKVQFLKFRECVNWQRPFGRKDWQAEVAATFRLGSTLRACGQPRIRLTTSESVVS